MNTQYLIYAYLASWVGGGVVAALVWAGLDWGVKKQLIKEGEKEDQAKAERIWWLSIITGIAERTMVTTVTIFAPKHLALFIGGWVALKFAGGWTLVKKPKPRHSYGYTIGLLTSAVSISCAIAAAAFFFPQNLLDYLSAPN